MAKSNRNSGKGGSLLDNGVAALAALSAGFATYAMPEGLFARLILASHIPDFLSVAQPPLGMKARLAVIGAVAVLVYAAVWTLLRALDSLGGAPHTVAAVTEETEEAPRLRRADAHPDAPSRRPIFAGRDLGEPAFDDEPFELEPEAAYEPEAESAFAPEPEAQPEVEPEHEPDHEPEHAAEPLPAFLVPQEPEPEIAHAPSPSFRLSVEPSFDEQEEEAEEESAEESEAYSGEEDDQSLSRLMQRFESGLGRKQQALDAAPPAAAPEPEMPPVPQERVGHRLRSAISDLGKISAPGR